MKTFEYIIKREDQQQPDVQQKEFIFGNSKNQNPAASYVTEPPKSDRGDKVTISTLDAQTLIQVAINRINDQVSNPYSSSGIDGAHKIILVLFLFSGMMSIMFLGKCIHGANIKFHGSSKLRSLL